jgi:RNA polymerase sigma-70 factor (ECF subfamily)
LIVGLARSGDRHAFAELVRRRQSSIRNLMRRCCGDVTLADDLAQQVFVQAWLKIRTLKKASAIGGWLKKVAISTWLQHLRKKDALRDAHELVDTDTPHEVESGVDMDLDMALATLPEAARLCIVLSYHEGMTHVEIAQSTDIPLGTVKSHIARGTEKLRQVLSAYKETGQEAGS